MGEALRGVGDPGGDPVHHRAASPSTQTVNPTRPISARFATQPCICNHEVAVSPPVVSTKLKCRAEHILSVPAGGRRSGLEALVKVVPYYFGAARGRRDARH